MTPYFSDALVTLYHGDCREVLPTIDISDVRLLLTDPPYGLDGEEGPRGPGGSRVRDFGVWDHDLVAIRALVDEVLSYALMRVHSAASCYVWSSHHIVGAVVDVAEKLSWSHRYLVWHKPSVPPAMPNTGWSYCTELCLYLYRGGRTWTHRCPAPRSLIVAGRVQSDDRHPCAKPRDVLAKLIRASSHPGDLVMDPFAGGGSTLLTARALGRRAIGIELDESWCEKIAMELSQGSLFAALEHEPESAL